MAVKFGVDPASVKAIEAALKAIPLELKGKPIESAQRSAVIPFKKEASRLGNELPGTGAWAKAQVITTGDDKRFKPYVVVRTGPKRFNVFSASPYLDEGKGYVARPIRYNHLIQAGQSASERTGGIGKKVGIVRPFSRGFKFGTVNGRRKTGRGAFTVRNAESGKVHRIASIKHPGFKGHNLYQEAFDSKKGVVEQKFSRDVVKVIERFKKRKGFQ